MQDAGDDSFRHMVPAQKVHGLGQPQYFKIMDAEIDHEARHHITPAQRLLVHV
ncbi:hypothetical protein UNDYM_5190 [Undibacterium sp. YM2]|nr:hypothetical protein UNDYM_5190 [Undibacterium sp. YM2]